MYEDAWFSPIVPTQPRQESSQKRRASLLKQPNEEDHADVGIPDALNNVVEASTRSTGPPEATLARRAKSYSDFYHVVRQQVKEDEKRARKATDRLGPSRRSSQLLQDSGERFDEYYEEVSGELLDTSNEKYRLYYERLHLSRNHLDSLLSDSDSNLELLSKLSRAFNTVEKQAAAFQERCETLLSEQRRISSLADDIGHNLQYYNYLDPITRRLNAPGVRHFVRGEDFLDMLAQLDECLEYMQVQHIHREASTYTSRYRLLMTRALTLIRVHFTNTLRETAADVSKRIADRQLNDTTMPALLYAKFRVSAPDLKRLGAEIQKRAKPPSGAEPGTQGEYQSLVNELHQSYSAARGRLIIPLARKKLAEIALAPSTSKDLVSFARSSIGYIRGICLDEYELWHQWFYGDDGLYEFLESVCEPLYDYLRPRTIHETSLPKLCEMCSLIQVRYMEDPGEDSEPEQADGLDFSRLLRSCLEDAQTRLVFQTLAVLRDDIERFKPKATDLNYPARNRNIALSGSKSKKAALPNRKKSATEPPTTTLKSPTVVEEDYAHDPDTSWRQEQRESPQGWFPTLQKAIWLLSKIYRLVNFTVFDDLAHQIVHQTTLSLLKASTLMPSRASAADRQLFLLKQFLILKQQIVAFDIEFVTPEINVDFSSITNTFWELRERGGLFDPRNIMRFLGNNMMPKVVENMLDAKEELDAQLRSVISEFTNGYASKMTLAVSKPTHEKRDVDAGKVVKDLRSTIEREVMVLRSQLDEYLEDVRTKETLVGAVQDQVLSNYDEFFEQHKAKARADGNAVSKRGKGRQDDVWDPDTFADWTITIFGVSETAMDDEGGSSAALSRSNST